MLGRVDLNCEAIVRLAVGNSEGKRQMVEALIDTGFTGFMTLPLPILKKLGLQAYRREEGILGDGSSCTFDVYRGLVIWDSELRSVDINASEAGVLIGMSLLYGYRMQMDAIEGGTVTITSLVYQGSTY